MLLDRLVWQGSETGRYVLNARDSFVSDIWIFVVNCTPFLASQKKEKKTHVVDCSITV